MFKSAVHIIATEACLVWHYSILQTLLTLIGFLKFHAMKKEITMVYIYNFTCHAILALVIKTFAFNNTIRHGNFTCSSRLLVFYWDGAYYCYDVDELNNHRREQ